jgi:hypothetical protein
MTKSVTGEQVADQIAQMFRDKGKTEQAYQNLKGEDKQETKLSTKIEKLTSSIEDTKTSIDDLENTVTEILKIVGDISKKLSPKDITVGKGEAAQTFRYDPLAPEGKKVTVVTGSGKAGRFASKKEAASVLSKAAYLGNLSQTPTPSTVEKLPRSPRAIRFAMQEAMAPMQQPMRRQIREPETYEELLGARRNFSKAEKTLRYGGSGLGRKALFGITKGLIGEGAALKIATLGRNKAQTEKAYQTVLNRGMDAQPTRTQVSAKAGIEGRTKSELDEENTEWKDDVIERLKRIERKIDNLDGGMLSGLLGGVGVGGLKSLLLGALTNPVVLGAFAVALSGAAIFKGYEKSQEAAGNVDAVREKIKAGENVTPEEMQQAREDENTAFGFMGAMAGGGYGMSAPMMTPQQLGYETIVDAEVRKQAERKAEIDRNIPSSIRRPTEFSPNVPIDFGNLESVKKNRIQPPMQPGFSRDKAQIRPIMDPIEPDVPVAPQNWETIKGAVKDPNTGMITLPDPESLPTSEPTLPPTTSQKLLDSQRTNEDLMEDNTMQMQTPQQPIIINNSSPPPPMPPPSKSGEGSGTIQIRNTEPSVATYSASIFDHPVTHPGIYKM